MSDFVRDTEPFRRELLAHSYRMLGSVHDAEDVVQETYLRAWRGYQEFENRSSVRTWMYRIATNVCLTALAHSSRRVLPSGLDAPAADPHTEPVPGGDVAWLQAIPDSWVEDPLHWRWSAHGHGSPAGPPACRISLKLLADRGIGGWSRLAPAASPPRRPIVATTTGFCARLVLHCST
jgi:hypothetical protein